MKKNDSSWRLMGASVLGANHAFQGKQNQDAIAWKTKDADTNACSTEVPFVVSLADGHGSERYFRSDIGAKSAVTIANEIFYEFAQDHELLPFSLVEVDAGRLPQQILARWKQDVESHWKANIPTVNEEAWLGIHPNAKKAIADNPTIPYGTTLITVLVTKRFILYCQVGDGNIVTKSRGDACEEPLLSDKRNFANETVSLCSATPSDFRLHFQQPGMQQPALIMLSTDGYANSFIEIQGFYKVASDIWNIISTDDEDGLQTVATGLQAWLERSTQMGSGDDITVGILCRLSAFQEQKAVVDADNSLLERVSPSLLPGDALKSGVDESTQPDPASGAKFLSANKREDT